MNLLQARLKHYAKRILGRPTVPPPVRGVADAGWYDAAYSTVPSYADPFWHSHYYFLWCVLADRIRRAGHRRVVDIGCGPGQLADCLFTLTPVESYVGLDFSTQAVQMAQQVCPRGRFVVGDATTMTLPREEAHDVLICTEVLEHVPNDKAVIERFAPGVPVLCTVPNFPYESHVRHFLTADSVSDRYAQYFDEFDVFGLIGHDAPKNVYWLMSGRRR